jgi:hypothetical protein
MLRLSIRFLFQSKKITSEGMNVRFDAIKKEHAILGTIGQNKFSID